MDQSCSLVTDQVEIPDVNLNSLLFEGITNPSTTVLVDVPTKRGVSREELLKNSENVACNLLDRGARCGDIIITFAANSVDHVILLLAAFRIGAIPAPVNFLGNADDVQILVDICQPKFIFTDETRVEIVRQALQNANSNQPISVMLKGNLPDCIDFNSLLNHPLRATQEIEPHKWSRSDPCLILFTSGTSGIPKAVSLSYGGVLYQCHLAVHRGIRFANKITVIVTQMCHGTGMFMTLSCVFNGYTAHIMVDNDFETFVKILSDNKIEDAFVLPNIATMLAKNDIADKYSLVLKGLICGGAPLSQEVEQLLQQRFPGLKVRQLYGMTETTALIACVPVSDTIYKPASIGVPVLNCQMKVVDLQTKATLGPNESGEIYIKSPSNMIGYINNPEATNETIDSDGFIHSGDIGYYDTDGYFFITDRLKEFIICTIDGSFGKVSVAPAQLEGILLSHPEVAEAVVIGWPAPEYGEVPTACVVRQPLATISEVALQKFVDDQVSEFNKLRGGVKFVSKIPKSPSGKIQRRCVKKEVMEGKLNV